MTIAADADPGAFTAPVRSQNSLLKRHLTASVRHALKDLKTGAGVTLHDCIRSGLSTEDSAIGLYAGDEESIELFSLLFAPVIQDCHRGFDAQHPPDCRLDGSSLRFVHPDPQGRFIRSTRLRLSRNLRGYRLMPAISLPELLAIEKHALAGFGKLDGDLAGSYVPAAVFANGDDTKDEGQPDWAQVDRFHLAAGISRAWPQGRGVFSNPQRTLQVWVNEEDHMRLISVQAGGDLQAVYARLLRANAVLEGHFDFQLSKRYGYLSSCPSNLGTGLRASFHMQLPRTGGSPAFKQLCANHDIEVRSATGESGVHASDMYDISNKRRLGLSPVQCIQELVAGAAKIIALEQSD